MTGPHHRARPAPADGPISSSASLQIDGTTWSCTSVHMAVAPGGAVMSSAVPTILAVAALVFIRATQVLPEAT
jgi:hypothetical protein